MQGLNTPISSFSHHHRRKNSSELDVFEAKQYFSGQIDHGQATKVEKKGLDIPIEYISTKVENKEKKANYRQPSSPSGRLASFLNSLFQQYYYSSTKKKSKKKKASPKPMSKGEEGSEGSRKRRSMSWDYTTSCYFASSSSSLFYSDKNICQGFDGEEIKLKTKKKGEVVKMEDEEQISDTSSDLFELKNIYDEFEETSSELPQFMGALIMRESLTEGGDGQTLRVILPTN